MIVLLACIALLAVAFTLIPVLPAVGDGAANVVFQVLFRLEFAALVTFAFLLMQAIVRRHHRGFR